MDDDHIYSLPSDLPDEEGIYQPIQPLTPHRPSKPNDNSSPSSHDYFNVPAPARPPPRGSQIQHDYHNVTAPARPPRRPLSLDLDSVPQMYAPGIPNGSNNLGRPSLSSKSSSVYDNSPKSPPPAPESPSPYEYEYYMAPIGSPKRSPQPGTDNSQSTRSRPFSVPAAPVTPQMLDSPTSTHSEPSPSVPYPPGEHRLKRGSTYPRAARFTMDTDATSVSTLEKFHFTPNRDPFFSSKKVLSLNSLNFTNFLKTMDATLVMFYDKRVSESKQYQKLISEAANCTKRANHAYAGVDCELNKKLCEANNATKVPMVRLYSQTFCVGEMKTLQTMTSDTLRQFVELAPLVGESRMVTCSRAKK